MAEQLTHMGPLNVAVIRPPVEVAHFPVGLSVRGNVLFHDNQVACLSRSEDDRLMGMSACIASTEGDVSVLGNQFDCEIFGPRSISNVFAHGTTLRMQGNHFNENLSAKPKAEVEQGKVTSAISIALLLNTTTDNQATHCIHAIALRYPNDIVRAHNTILVEVMGLASCRREIKGQVTLGKKQPVSGALVSVLGSDEKAVTGPDGHYRIVVPDGDAALFASYGEFRSMDRLVRRSHRESIDLELVEEDKE